MNTSKTLYTVQAAMIAAIYVVLTGIAAGFDLANGAIQVRFSEALTILPFFTPAAVPGLAVGCLLSNLLFSGNIFDIIFGSLATLIGAWGTRKLRGSRYLCSVPPIVSNMLIIPPVLTFAYHIPGGIPFQMLTVGAGEVICCFVFGQILISALQPLKGKIFPEA